MWKYPGIRLEILRKEMYYFGRYLTAPNTLTRVTELLLQQPDG
jgi:hypothetical protein